MLTTRGGAVLRRALAIVCVLSIATAITSSVILAYESYSDSRLRARLAPRTVGSAAGFVRDSSGPGVGWGSSPLVVFTDYSCTACRALHERLASLPGSLQARITVHVRHAYGEHMSPVAKAAAVAVECARDADRFEAANSMMYDLLARSSASDWVALAVAIEVEDPAGFASCVRDQQTRSRIEADMHAQSALRLAGTPSFIWNSTLYTGAPPRDELIRLLTEGLERDSAP